MESAAIALTAEFVARSDGEGRESLAHRLGDRTPADAVAAALGMESAAARALASVAEAVTPRVSLQGELLPPPVPPLAAAVAAGRVGIDAGAGILRVLEQVAAVLDHDEREALTVELIAAANDLAPRAFRRLCREVPAFVVPQDEELREQRLRDARGLRISTLPDGSVRWVLTLDPESAGFLTTALDARTAPRREVAFRDARAATDATAAADATAATDATADAAARSSDAATVDRRPLHHRRLDALVDLARESLGRDAGELAGATVTMLVTVSLDALESGVGSAGVAGVDARISAATARRLAADAELIPVVLGGPSEVLDLGRAQRLFSRAQRRALAVRDGGCVWPGCEAPPGWCEVAHVRPWSRGGPTDLDNGALLCRFHHRRFDRDGWSLHGRDAARVLVPPPWLDGARRPRPIRTTATRAREMVRSGGATDTVRRVG